MEPDSQHQETVRQREADIVRGGSFEEIFRSLSRPRQCPFGKDIDLVTGVRFQIRVPVVRVGTEFVACIRSIARNGASDIYEITGVLPLCSGVAGFTAHYNPKTGKGSIVFTFC